MIAPTLARTLRVCVPLAALGLLAFAGPSYGAERCVSRHPACSATLQGALDAADPGDTVRLGRGTFDGGASVTKSVTLVGAGPFATTVRGGGPVLTIGTFDAASEPTVSIRDMTITGGRTTSSPQSMPFYGSENVQALGGGIEIPPAKDLALGATVTIDHARIIGNRVAPTASVPSGRAGCPDGPCPFALAAGGGIDSWGSLTLNHSVVSGNRVGSASGISALASDAQSGAIQNWQGPLTITDSRIIDNQASATAPNGRFADAGGIFVEGGEFTMAGTTVSKNMASLAAALPRSVDLLAIAGGIHVSGRVPAPRISDTIIVGNAVKMSNTVGSANAFSGGLHVDGGDLVMHDSLLVSNRVVSATLAGSTGNAAGDSGAGELGGELYGTHLNRNTVTVASVAGNAQALGGAAIVTGSLSDGDVSMNRVRAISPQGTASVAGGGLFVGDKLTLRDVTVNGNRADARAHSGSARGGGIYDAEISDGPPGGPLALAFTPITGNRLTGSAGILKQGAGLYILDRPLTRTDSPIVGNHPDQCSGC
jgi:hypothetical protein